MAVFSGRFGSIANCGQVAQWSLELSASDNAQSNSATKAGKMRDPGIKDWTGSCTFLGNTFPGSFSWSDSQNITLKTGGPSINSGGHSFTGKAHWTSIAISGDITSGGRVQCQVSFAGDGALTSSSGGGNGDSSPNILLAKDCVITFDGNTLAWKSFNFTINHEVQELVDSSCVDDGEIWKKRYAGLIDCTGSIDWVGDEEQAELNDIGALVIVCGSTQILNIGKARYMGMSGFTADPSSGALVGGSSNFSMCAHDDGGSMGSLSVYGNALFPPSGGSTPTS